MYREDGGYFLIDKAKDWSSFHVVNKIRYLFKHVKNLKLKVGHAGTLDPLATGLLIVCYGKMTKKIESFQDMYKEYTGTFYLGATTPSFDLETDVDQTFPTDHITNDLIMEVSKSMTGLQVQSPPVFSAIKVDGKRAYEYARKGVDVETKSREIEVKTFECSDLHGSEVHFKISCSKGTYIRSLANDFGKKLKSGAYLKELRRTAIGAYRVEEAMTIEQLESFIKSKPFELP
jgi:tRNA pseudouridine55 synthase